MRTLNMHSNVHSVSTKLISVRYSMFYFYFIFLIWLSTNEMSDWWWCVFPRWPTFQLWSDINMKMVQHHILEEIFFSIFLFVCVCVLCIHKHIIKNYYRNHSMQTKTKLSNLNKPNQTETATTNGFVSCVKSLSLCSISLRTI